MVILVNHIAVRLTSLSVHVQPGPARIYDNRPRPRAQWSSAWGSFIPFMLIRNLVQISEYSMQYCHAGCAYGRGKESEKRERKSRKSLVE